MNSQSTKLHKESVQGIRRRRKKGGRYYAKQVFRSANVTAGYKESALKQEYLNYLINGYGISNYNPACSVPVRRLLSELLSELMVQTYRKSMQPKGQVLYHLTLASLEHQTGDSGTTIHWSKIKRRASTLMADVSKDFIGVGEVDVTINEKYIVDGVDKGRDLCPHFHILFWTDKEVEPDNFGEQLSKRFPEGMDGMKAVKITRCPNTEEDITRMASYLFKAPTGGKSKWMKKKFNSDGSLASVKATKLTSKKLHRAIIFSRIAEILSHTNIRTLLISGGEGIQIKSGLLKVLSTTTGLLGTYPPQDFGYDKTLRFWKSMRRNGWGKNYLTPDIQY